MADYLEQQKQTMATAQSDVAQRTAEDQKTADTYGSMFQQYYVSRHDQNGHMFADDGDALSSTQKAEMAYYSQRRIREQDMRSKGVNDADIAMMRAWDEDIVKAQANGQQVNTANVLSAEYAQQAQQKFNYDESMYNHYVATSRQLSKEEWDPDGDGVFNVVDDVLKEYEDYNDEDIANSFDYMTADVKRGLAFDGIHDRQGYVKYMKGKIQEYKDAHSGFGYNLGQFFKGIVSGVISGVMDLVKLPGTIISLGAALFTGTFDNAVSRGVGSFNAAVDKNTSEAWNNAVDLDPDSGWGKAGTWVGQAVEIAGEALLTGGISVGVDLGAKVAGKIGTKLTDKAIEKVGEKAITKASASLVTRTGARRIEREAMKVAAKAGTKRVTEEHIVEATNKVLGKEIEKIGTGKGSKVYEKIVQDATSGATVRLARRGAYKVTAKTTEKLGESAAEKGISRVTTGVADKISEKAATKAAKKAGEKIADKTTVKEIDKEVVKSAGKAVSRQVEKKEAISLGKRTVSQIKNKFTGKATMMSVMRKGTQEHMIGSMASKGNTVIGKTLRTVFGKRDPLTRLFALKSFATQVDASQARGDSPFSALARATLAYGATNMVWGGVFGAASENKIKSMVTRNLGTKKFGEVVSSKLARTMIKQSGAVISVAGKMMLDGTIHEMIDQGFSVDKDTGKFQVGIMKTIKDNINWSKIAEDFSSALTMHVAGGTLGLGRKVVGKGVAKVPFISKKRHATVMAGIDSMLGDSDTGLGQQVWQQYKDKARDIEGKNASDAKVIDTAASLAQDAKGSVGRLVTEIYVKTNAKAYGGALKANIKDIADHQDSTVKSVNKGVTDIIVKAGGDPKNLDLNDKYWTEFSELASFNNANLFDGEVVPDDIAVNNWQPEDYALGFARFKKSKVDVSTASSEDSMKAVHAAFKEVEQIKAIVGENTGALLNRSFDQITKLTDMLLDPVTADNAKKWVDMEAEVKKLFKDGKATEEAIKDVIDKYNIDMKEVNTKQSEGVIVDDVKTVVKNKEVTQRREYIKALNSKDGHDKFIDKRVNAEAKDPKGDIEEVNRMVESGMIKVEEGKRLSADLYDAFKDKDPKYVKDPSMNDAKRYSEMREADNNHKASVKRLEDYKKKVEARRSTITDVDEFTGQQKVTESEISLREAADLDRLLKDVDSAHNKIIKLTIDSYEKRDFKDVVGHEYEDAEIKQHDALSQDVKALIQTTKESKIHIPDRVTVEDVDDRVAVLDRKISELADLVKSGNTSKSDEISKLTEEIARLKIENDKANEEVATAKAQAASSKMINESMVDPIGDDYVDVPVDDVEVSSGETKEEEPESEGDETKEEPVKEPDESPKEEEPKPETKKPKVKKTQEQLDREEYEKAINEFVDKTDPSCAM